MTANRRLHYGAVILGAVLDTAGTIVSMIGIIALTVAGAMVAGEDAEQAMDAWSTQPILFVFELVLGLAWSAAGGFVAAAVAGREPVRHAAWVGALTLLLGFLLWMLPMEGDAAPLWFDVLSVILIIPACIAGGVLGGKFLSRRNGVRAQ